MSAQAPNDDLLKMTTQSDIAVVLPEPEIIKMPLPDGTTYDLKIMPLPFRRWRVAFRYIAQVAPLFGFNLAETNLDQLADSLDKKDGAPVLDKGTIFEAMQGDKADVIYEFLAFAIGKFQSDGVTPDVSFFDDVYEQAIDIAVAVIKVNINFFIQRLLPRLTNGTKEIMLNVGGIKASTANLSTSTPEA